MALRTKEQVTYIYTLDVEGLKEDSGGSGIGSVMEGRTSGAGTGGIDLDINSPSFEAVEDL